MPPDTRLTPDAALQRLKEGNRRFLAGEPSSGTDDPQRRLAVAQQQAPFAVLVSCSGSRVPPEILFRRGLGELFIVRNAGNTVDATALGSIEFAVAHLHVPLVVVMGHQRCGAVAAALSVVRDDMVFPGSLGRMIEPIVPAVLTAQRREGDVLDNAVRENVRRVVARLRSASEPMLLDPLAAGTLRIVGAHYGLDEGAVEFFEEG